MTVANGQGAMYKLTHDQANVLLAIRQMTEELIEALERSEKGDDGQLGIALSVLGTRREKIGELESLGKRIAFLHQSGYEPGPEEQARIEEERPMMEALYEKIRALEAQASALMAAAQESLMVELKDVKDGKRSIRAYAAPQDEEEGFRLDTRG